MRASRPSRARTGAPRVGQGLGAVLVALLLSAGAAAAQDPPAQPQKPGEGAGSDPGAATPAAAASGEVAPEEQTIELLPVPEPELSGLDPDVAAQLADSRSALDEILASGTLDVGGASEVFGELGRLYQAYGFVEPAEAAYRNAATLDPTSFRWRYYLGRLLHEAGRLDEAEHFYARALDLEPNRTEVMVYLGDLFLTRGNLEMAETGYRRALAISENLPAALAGLGQVALSRRDYAAAAEHLEAALAAVPQATRLHYPLALAYRGLGRVDDARRHLALRGEVGVRPPDPLMDELEDLKRGERAFILRGRLAFRAGRYDEAAAAFRQAVEARPDSVPARVNLGTALGQLGDRVGAIHQFRQALEVDPDNPTAHFNLGALLAAEGALEPAIVELGRAVELAPADLGARRELGRLLGAAGRHEEALAEYGRAVALDPFDVASQIGEAEELVALGRYQDAYSTLDLAYALMPREPRVVAGLARILAASPDPAVRDGARATELARMLFAAEPTAGHAATLVLALAEIGECAEAAALLQKVIDANEEAGIAADLPALRAELARLEAGPPCRPPASLSETK